MNKKSFYVTAAIPYVNAQPHIGHALEFIQVDVIARFYRLLGNQVITLTGSDENALKNVQAAETVKIPVQQFVDQNADLFLLLTKELNTPFDVFQKGTNPDHFKSSQDLWTRCFNNGDIYKKNYQGLYCLGCEAFYTHDELINGECNEHPGKKLETVSESNYFFKLSKYQQQLIDLINSNNLKIIPEYRKTEVLNFLRNPLQDISISRSNERAKNWGVPVPNDDSQRMYVWFDALNIYRSGVSNDVWPADIHVIGKGIMRFHAIFWPAFLLSAKLPLPNTIFAHGYLTIDGQKMSKTIGNIIDPHEVINKYGVDALRYYLLKEIPSTEDGDFSYRRMEEIYNSDLANELGNLVSRVTTLGEKDKLNIDEDIKQSYYDTNKKKLMESFQFHLALESIWSEIKIINKNINDYAPWSKQANDRKEFLIDTIKKINFISHQLLPFLPDTADKIIRSTSGIIKKISPLFPRLNY